MKRMFTVDNEKTSPHLNSLCAFNTFYAALISANCLQVSIECRQCWKQQLEMGKSVDIDQILAKCGDFNRYQFMLLGAFCLINVISSMHYYSQTIISFVPEHWWVESFVKFTEKFNLRKFRKSFLVALCNCWKFIECKLHENAGKTFHRKYSSVKLDHKSPWKGGFVSENEAT